VIEEDANLSASRIAEAAAAARPPLGQRLRAALLPATAAHWGWWAAGLGMGLTIATVAVSLAAPAAAPVPTGGKAMEAMVKAAILANPEVIPEAINRLQQLEVEKLLASNRKAIETPFAGAWVGAEDGDVVLVEFFDFNCPYCRQSIPDVDRLLREDPKLKVVFRDMPVLGPDSERFARASLSAARQGRYRQFYTGVFDGQGALSQERLIRTVRAAGLNEARVASDLSSKEVAEEIGKNIDLGRALGLTGTPSYVVGNQILSGAVGYDALKEAVAAARKANAG
jgi:protein-disulfide isomerase